MLRLRLPFGCFAAFSIFFNQFVHKIYLKNKHIFVCPPREIIIKIIPLSELVRQYHPQVKFSFFNPNANRIHDPLAYSFIIFHLNPKLSSNPNLLIFLLFFIQIHSSKIKHQRYCSCEIRTEMAFARLKLGEVCKNSSPMCITFFY
jgi:hypothetical protein